MTNCFFIPRVGKDYESGFQGIRTLILGSHFYCPYADCPHLHKECASSSSIRNMDTACPCYIDKEDQEYYRLSNSDEIEVESYLEGFPYPAFDAFTSLLLKKRDYLTEAEKRRFWDQVAFTNYIQHYWPNGYTPSYADNKELFDTDYEAFREVLLQLKPQVVYVWHEAIKDCLRAHDDLRFIGMTNMPIISTYLFVYNGAEPSLSSQQLNSLVLQYGIMSEEVTVEWLQKLLCDSFRVSARNVFEVKTIYVEDRNQVLQRRNGEADIKNFATFLKRCVGQGLLVREGDRLAFAPSLARWHKEIFLKRVKDYFALPKKGANAAFGRMFDYLSGHYQITNKKDDEIVKQMNALFNKVKFIVKLKEPGGK